MVGVHAFTVNTADGMIHARNFAPLYDIDEVAMTIYQPRRENISTWTISVADLKAWAEDELVPRAKLAFEGKGEYLPGPWCTFCKAAVKCRARAEEKLADASLSKEERRLAESAKRRAQIRLSIPQA